MTNNERRVFIGLFEVDFENLKEGDKFILREPDGKLVGFYTATGDAGVFNDDNIIPVTQPREWLRSRLS